jgi:hypothetical protein
MKRTTKEIQQALDRIIDLVWYQRYLTWKEEGRSTPESEEAAKKLEATYPQEELADVSDYDLGMLEGKLSALRWVIGDEWDDLDT